MTKSQSHSWSNDGGQGQSKDSPDTASDLPSTQGTRNCAWSLYPEVTETRRHDTNVMPYNQTWSCQGAGRSRVTAQLARPQRASLPVAFTAVGTYSAEPRCAGLVMGVACSVCELVFSACDEYLRAAFRCGLTLAA